MCVYVLEYTASTVVMGLWPDEGHFGRSWHYEGHSGQMRICGNLVGQMRIFDEGHSWPDEDFWMFDEGHFGDVFGQMRIFDEGHFWPDEDFWRGPSC
jgi:hypothetical protein